MAIEETEVTDEEGVTTIIYEISFKGKSAEEINAITEFLKYEDYLSKWTGELPSVVAGDSATIMIPASGVTSDN